MKIHRLFCSGLSLRSGLFLGLLVAGHANAMFGLNGAFQQGRSIIMKGFRIGNVVGGQIGSNILTFSGEVWRVHRNKKAKSLMPDSRACVVGGVTHWYQASADGFSHRATGASPLWSLLRRSSGSGPGTLFSPFYQPGQDHSLTHSQVGQPSGFSGLLAQLQGSSLLSPSSTDIWFHETGSGASLCDLIQNGDKVESVCDPRARRPSSFSFQFTPLYGHDIPGLGQVHAVAFTPMGDEMILITFSLGDFVNAEEDESGDPPEYCRGGGIEKGGRKNDTDHGGGSGPDWPGRMILPSDVQMQSNVVK